MDVSTDTLAGATQAYFRVVVSDGVNIGWDQSDAPVAIPGHAPEAIITSPVPGMRFAPGGLVVLHGMGTDMEDGLLPAVQLAWKSDRDGDLGTGDTLMLDSLSPGKHTLTLTATDSDKNTGVARVQIVVNTAEDDRMDLNRDGMLNQADLLELIARWHHSVAKGYPPTLADFNTDGQVDGKDLFLFQEHWQGE